MAAHDRTHYDVLGIARDVDAAQVRSAWKLHVQAWHPDRFTGEMRAEAERQTSRINEAYTALRDCSRRAAYDCRLAADDRDADRVQSMPRASVKMRPAAPRAASTPVGTPMAAAEPANLSEQLVAVANEAVRAARRHPRILAAVAVGWVAVLGGGAALHSANGPTLPASATPTLSASAAARVAPSDTADLEQLAEQAQRDAAQAEADMSKLLAEEEAAAQAAEAADAAAAAAAPQLDPRAGAAAAPKVPGTGATATAAPPRRRIVRVMPANPMQ